MPKLPRKPASIYLGIDPGKHGGLVAMVGFEVEWKVMPDTCLDLIDWLTRVLEGSPGARCYVVLEQVYGGPQMSKPGAFTFGRNFGNLEMLIASLANEGLIDKFELSRPQDWQKALHVPPRKKKEPDKQWKRRLRAMAIRLFPKLPLWKEPKTLGKQMAIADALLIAAYCKQVNKE